MNAEIKEIIELINEINQHKSLNHYLKKIENYTGLTFLSTDYLNELNNKDIEFEALLYKLDGLACGSLITNKGQHSNLFYEIKNHGIYSETGERDNFGPLSSLIGPGDKSWIYVYG